MTRWDRPAGLPWAARRNQPCGSTFLPTPVAVVFLSPRSALPAALALAALLSPLPATAHGDDQVIIEALTEELAKAPSADLHLRRGELFRHHREWERAEADYTAAARLEPALAIIDYFRSRARLEAGAPGEALPLVERFLAAAPREAEGWYLRGEILAALDRPVEAAAGYADGLACAAQPRPEHFLRRARLLAAASPGEPARVLAAVDEGLARLGPIVSLVDEAIALELARGHPAGALTRIAAALERAPRREAWLVRQGDVLVQCGRRDEAIASYRGALAAIAELPERYRTTVPVEKLARDARQSLERLSAR
jgi:predicted Zn-dependent protease